MNNRRSVVKVGGDSDKRHSYLCSCWKDIACVVLLFSLAWYCRSVYQSESITDEALRADAGKYALAAYNLRVHGMYSSEVPSAETPKTRTDLPPGYPCFLREFFYHGDKGWFFDSDSVRKWQNLMGCLVVLFTFAIARQALSQGWSLLAGVLTCLSPHLIAISDYILTESLFTVLMMAGTWILALSWRYSNVWLIFLGGLLITLSSEVRYISLLMPFFFLPIFFFKADWTGRTNRKTRIAAVIAILVGFLSVQALHGVFVRVAVRNSADIQEIQKKSFRLKTPWGYISKSMQPPNYYVDGGNHVGMKNPDRKWKARTTKSFSEAPLAYLRWNLYGRALVLWHFDNVYNGDVYLYPMLRKGFVVHETLNKIHFLMRLLHWWLFALALGGLVLLATMSWRGTLPAKSQLLWVPALGFAYYLAVLNCITWLPRYTIPVRPFSYIMAAGCMAYLVARLNGKLPQSKEVKATGKRPARN